MEVIPILSELEGGGSMRVPHSHYLYFVEIRQGQSDRGS